MNIGWDANQTEILLQRIRQSLPLAALLLAGCASAPATNLTSERPQDQAQIRRVLEDVFDAAEKKELGRLDSYHFYGPKFTKFAPESDVRQDAAAAQQGEHDGLSAVQNLSMQADGLKIDVFGDVGIATFIMNYSFKAGAETIARKARGTLVFVKAGGAWKITHEHFSALRSDP